MTTIASLTEKILAFRDERDWLQFHNPKDMAAAIAIEAAEIQELFFRASRVLLRQGIRGCYVFFQDKETENFFRSRIETIPLA